MNDSIIYGPPGVIAEKVRRGGTRRAGQARGPEGHCPDCVHPWSAHAAGACQASKLEPRSMKFTPCGCQKKAAA